ncbi:MAG: hypothetical protein A2W35_14185 [Chloroflexi bacterium RBG_16_57_11]|nr:MAG: hypothetical protein A2W35_14185 [Chloroflexi bacterium RBG_16_57_11]
MGSALAVRVSPRSSRNEVAEILNDGTVRIRLTASGDEEKINHALVNYLAEILAVSHDRVEIVAGVSGKDKLVSVVGLDTAELQARILEMLS